MAVWFIFFVIFVIIVIVRTYEKNTNAIFKSNKRLDGKVALVTGGTAGMGLVIATDLAHRGARVIIACPFEEEGNNARDEIVNKTGNEKVIFKLLNLASPGSVRQFAAEILEEENRLDILVNNAGVGIPETPKSYSGINFIIHVNYLGHFLLTILLLPLLRETGTKSENSRIINTGSPLHLLGTVDFECKTRVLYRFFSYCNSKLCCTLFSHELSRRLKGSNVVVNTVSPGVVGTGIFENIWGSSFITFFFNNVYKTPWEGAQTALYAALDEETGKVTGQLFSNCKLARAKRSAYNDDLGSTLWKESVKTVKLESNELNALMDE